jgi:hypothetical protein
MCIYHPPPPLWRATDCIAFPVNSSKFIHRHSILLIVQGMKYYAVFLHPTVIYLVPYFRNFKYTLFRIIEETHAPAKQYATNGLKMESLLPIIFTTKTYGRRWSIVTNILDWVLYGCEWLNSLPGSGTHWLGRWIGPIFWPQCLWKLQSPFGE